MDIVGAEVEEDIVGAEEEPVVVGEVTPEPVVGEPVVVTGAPSWRRRARRARLDNGGGM